MTHKPTLVVGTGATATSCLDYLSGKTDLFLTDTRIPHDEEVRATLQVLKQRFGDILVVDPGDLDNLLDKDWVVYVSPGVPLYHPLCGTIRKSGAHLSSDIELFLTQVDRPVIGITGTNGKSTTTDLVGKMLSTQDFVTGGNIGTPALELLHLPAEGYVLELSSFQLERMKPPALESAAILNITADHLDHHRSFDAYAASKHRIYERTKTAIYNNADPVTVPIACDNGIAINGRQDWCVKEDSIVFAGHELAASEIELTGEKNHLNVVMAAALAHCSGASIDEIVDVASTYKGLPHRTQLVAEINEVRYINDSKATNVAATYAALTNFGSSKRNIVLLAGGDGKDAYFKPLAEPLRAQAKMVVLYGRDAKQIASAVRDSVPLSFADSLMQAVETASDIAEAGDIVLFSPACASFDMFENYKDRGNQFERIVRGLAA